MVPGILSPIFVWCCYLRKLGAVYQANMEQMKQYVTVTLNDEWQQSKGIRWSIVPENFAVTTTRTVSRNGHSYSQPTVEHYILYNVGITVVEIERVALRQQAGGDHEPERDAVEVFVMESTDTDLLNQSEGAIRNTEMVM
mmetsp:Transcript_22673/g.36244  ORF Transcript_22673/g.36244 Transcript_22673/m.36244 type:complete len:140 (+) Transcript_22673:352-771(+)